MKRNYIRYIPMALLAITASSMPARSQYVLRQAEEQATLYNYALAIPLYNKAYKKKASLEAARGLAESYRRTNNFVFAESWYAKVVAMPDHTAQDKFHYAEVLMNNSKYAEAKEMLNAYLTQKPGDVVAEKMLEGCSNAVEWLSNPASGSLENVQALNSPWSDWGTALLDGRLVFASDRPYDPVGNDPFFSNRNIARKGYKWTGNSYLHLYRGDGRDSTAITLLEQDVNGDYHNATASYTADGNTMYCAATLFAKKGRSFLGKEEPFTLNVEIQEFKKDSAGNWKRSAPFPYNAIFKYSVGDPWISPDGSELYFVAKYGEKGLGGTDIYYCKRGPDGAWTAPLNMGAEINAPGDERTPVFDKNGTLYFASNGRAGMGGLDIYKATRDAGGQWTVSNMGSPVNSPQDDFAPAPADGGTLYFSSNRLAGKGSDDIYRFKPKEVLEFTIEGRIVDRETNTPLANAVVTLENAGNGAPLTAITDSDGNYHFRVGSAGDYQLSVVKTGYSTIGKISLPRNELSASSKVRKDVALGKAELNRPQKIENIYFDLDKSDIRKDAAIELDKLVKLLQDNPTWEVEMSSHTDARANDSYNMKLSQRRAAATVAYLVSKGISGARLSAKGYGETRLVNKCANGVDCTEAEHQANRRTAFTILSK